MKIEVKLYKKKVELFLFSIFFFVLFSMVSVVAQTPLDISSGSIIASNLEGISDSSSWTGVILRTSGTGVVSAPTPVSTLDLSSPGLYAATYAADDYVNDNYWWAASHASEFVLENLSNVSNSDLLEAAGLFNTSHYSILYPDFDTRNDNVNSTFCCDLVDITISAINYSAFRINLTSNIDYYMLKYDDAGSEVPIFFVEFVDYVCYNLTSCEGQLFLPVSNFDYNLFILSKFTQYNVTMYVNSVQTTIITQTALPYNVTVEVTDFFNGTPLSGIPVALVEEDGQNIFVPNRFEGEVSYSYSVGSTGADGRESFLVAPSVYPTIDNYTIYGAVYQDERFLNKEELTVAAKDSVVQQSVDLGNTLLQDNAKVSVNAINQINAFLFRWASSLLQAKSFTVRYELVGNSFIISDAVTGGSNVTLKSGALNVLNLVVTSGGITQSGYSLRVKETGGYLIFNPYTGTSPLSAKQRNHDVKYPSTEPLVVTPTSLGSVQSNITLEVMLGDAVIDTYVAYIDDDLNIATGGVFYNDDQIKTIVNNMNTIIYSLFYALNN